MHLFIYSILSILISVALLLSGSGLKGTLLSLRGAESGFSETQIGILMSAYYLGYIMVPGYAASVINAVGHIRLFAAVAALSSALLLMQGMWVNFWFWMFARVCSGAAMFSFFLVVESWLNARTDHRIRGKVFSIYMFVNLFALASSQQLLLLGSVSDLTLFAVGAVFFCISLIPVCMTRMSQPEPIERNPLRLRDIRKVPLISLLGSFTSGVAGGAFFAMAPLFAYQLGMQKAAVAAMMSLAIVSGAVFQWPVGILSDRMDRRRILLSVCVVAALAIAATAMLHDHSQWAFLASMALYGAMFLTIYPLAAAYANDGLSDGDYVAVGAGLLASYGVGAALGPITVGKLMHLFGPAALPGFLSMCWLALALYIVSELWRKVPALDANDAAEFVPMVRTASLAMEVSLEEHNHEALPERAGEDQPNQIEGESTENGEQKSGENF